MSRKRRALALRMTRVAIGVNAVLAVAKIALGIASLSGFMIVSALYSVGMMTAKAYIHAGLSDAGRRRGPHEYFRIIGIVLLISSALFAIYSLRMLIGGRLTLYTMEIGIGIAAITFTEIGLNIRSVRVHSRGDQPMLHANGLIGLASSLMGLVMTQAALLSFADNQAMPESVGITGIVFGGLNCSRMNGIMC